MDLPPDVIDRSAEEGARLVALALLHDCEAAADRLAHAGDPEALHDFRVGLRRLRSTLRAYGPWLEGSVRAKSVRRLEKLARGTNDARDAEVQLAFLAEQEEALGARRRSGLEFLRERFAARRRAGEGDGGGALAERYRRVARKLGRRLASYERHLGGGSEPFAAAVATIVREGLAKLRGRLERVEGATDEEHVHRARIAGKRLRYVLEPLRGNPRADATGAVKHLKRLQDLLGDLHDAHVLSREIASALVDAAAERARQLHAALDRGEAGAKVGASPRGGVLAMVRLVRERRDALYAELQRGWRGGGLDALAAEIAAVAEALEARAGGKIETERKYLLASLPPRAGAEGGAEIEQGYLPGERLRERVRRVRAPDGSERFWRAVKQGAPPRRLETEEETTRDVFEALWPLTEGHRVRKVRHRVAEGSLTWEIDRFTDRDLVLAEVELPPSAPEPPLPEWLLPFVVREVTADPAYGNAALAAAGGAVPADAAPDRGSVAAAPEGAAPPP